MTEQAMTQRAQATVVAIERMLLSERSGATYPAAHEKGFERCETVQVGSHEGRMLYEVLSMGGDTLMQVVVRDDGSLMVLDEHVKAEPSMPATRVAEGDEYPDHTATVEGHRVEFEQASDGGWGAFVPDLPGCIAMGATREEARELIAGSIRMHVCDPLMNVRAALRIARQQAGGKTLRERLEEGLRKADVRLKTEYGLTLLMLTSEEPVRVAAQTFADELGIPVGNVDDRALMRALRAASTHARTLALRSLGPEMTLSDIAEKAKAYGLRVTDRAVSSEKVGCTSCEQTFEMGTVGPTDVCPNCGADTVIALVEFASAADVGRRDPASEPRAGAREGQRDPVVEAMSAGAEREFRKFALRLGGDVLSSASRRPVHGGFPDAEPREARCSQCGDTVPCPADRLMPGGTCGHPRFLTPWADARRRWVEFRDGAVRAPDLVSRMLDARDCLRAPTAPTMDGTTFRAVQGALRWLDEGIEEGMRERDLRDELRQLVAGGPHVCVCGDVLVDAAGVACPTCRADPHASCVSQAGVVLPEAHPARARLAVQEARGCSDGYDERCRFEAALRRLLGVS